jgi:prepilin-type N-terminal cleavage/methylation domain-containing protein
MFRIFRYKRGIKGFTLFELLITLALISVLLGAIWMVYAAGFKTFYTQGTRSGIKGEVGRLLITISGELRKSGSIIAANQTSLTFALDSDDNGVDESVQYLWQGIAGGPVNRIADTTIPAVNSVNNLSFSYYDAGNNLLSFPVTASQVRSVAINITAAKNDEAFQLRTSVRLRNL